MNVLYRSCIHVSIVLVSMGWPGFSYSSSKADVVRPVGANAYQIVTGDDSEGDQKRWNRFYSTQSYVYGKEPAPFLREHEGILKRYIGGRVLDIAMGEGRNSVFLARMGFSSDGIDISEVALRKAKRLARENKVNVSTVIADLTNYKIKPETYDVILNFDYTQRSLIPEIKKGLRRRGIVIYQSDTVDQLSNEVGEHLRRDNLLARGELKEMFKGFEVLSYKETNDGKSAKASLIARKP